MRRVQLSVAWHLATSPPCFLFVVHMDLISGDTLYHAREREREKERVERLAAFGVQLIPKKGDFTELSQWFFDLTGAYAV